MDLKYIFSRPRELALAKSGAKLETIRPETELTRVRPEKLEKAYFTEPLVFSAVNFISHACFSAGYQLSSNSPKEIQTTQKFLDSIEFKMLMFKTAQHLCIYGNAWWEIIYSKSGKLVGVDWIDPKSMDFLRNSQGQIKYNKYGLPEGYVQYIDLSKHPGIPSSKIVKQVDAFGDYRDGIKLSKDKIIHLPLYTVGDQLYAIGLIEPIYPLCAIKRKIERSFANAVLRYGFPLYHIKVGNDKYPALPNDVDAVSEDLSDISSRSLVTTAHWINIEPLSPKLSDIHMEKYLSYFEDLIVAGLGIPKPLITGKGESTNKATLDRQASLLVECKIKYIQYLITQTFTTDILTPFSEQHNFSEIPKIIWEEYTLESISSKAERLTEYAKSGLLEPDESVKQYIKTLENIP